MTLNSLDKVLLSGDYKKISACIRGRETPCSVFGLSEAAKVFYAGCLCGEGRPLLYLTFSEQAAERAARDLSFYLGQTVAVFPARQNVLYRATESNQMNEARVNVLTDIMSWGENDPKAVVATVDAVLYPLLEKELLAERFREITMSDVMEISDLARWAGEAGYTCVEKVEQRGQFAYRGGIFDIFPLGAEYPCRIELFGDEIDSIRTFSADTQRSVQRIDSVQIPPAREIVLTDEIRRAAVTVIQKSLAKRLKKSPSARLEKAFREVLEGIEENTYTNYEGLIPYLYENTSLLWDYLPASTLVVVDEPKRVRERAENVYLEFTEVYKSLLEEGSVLPEQVNAIFEYETVVQSLDHRQVLSFQMLASSAKDFLPKALFTIGCKNMQSFAGREDVFLQELSHYLRTGYEVHIVTSSRRQESLTRSLAQADLDGLDRVCLHTGALVQGFELIDLKVAVISEQDLFGQQLTKSVRKARGKNMDAFLELAKGDYVVHEASGIGIYEGLVKLETDGTQKDYLSIKYAGTDRLYVPVENMDMVQKYVGGKEQGPKLSKLGSAEWQHAKRRVKSAIRDMTDELVKLYAARQQETGYCFAPDTPWQVEFEQDFEYEETPDQLQCIAEIKRDMESPKNMDRLLCGDVGYGKTEVAVRAIFKAIMSGKQAAILCPTTILAHQHYNTLTQRMQHYGVRCEVLSRFKSAAEQKKVIESLRQGTLDVIVGTHRLLSKDVTFRDLGLLVIDEEQRFGVSHKERIKMLKNNVDVLTLSATPIPRTLHMALSGIRDLSVIETAPQERFPVQTFVLEYSDTLVRDAIMRELGRGGQVYFVYNNVANMDLFAEQLRQLVPEARIIVGHGQMNENLLERTVEEFYEGKADVFLCSTIIENGVDVPGANTIFVYDADRFGLSQLYQLKGRVGRSNRLAYAYFMFRRNSILTEVAEKRLAAIRDFTALGSGFKIAMRDLEIRGAGNLLGGEQHGYMASVGYDMYCKLLEEAVGEMKGIEVQTRTEAKIEIATDAYIPKDYIGNEVQKLNMYKKIAAIDTKAQREDIIDELIDVYGDPPKCVENLLSIALLKGLCARAGVEKVVDKGFCISVVFARMPDLEAVAEAIAENEMCHISANAGMSLILNKGKSDAVQDTIEIIHRYLELIEKKKS